MFPRPAAGAANARDTGGKGRGAAIGRWDSRVRGEPERFGEFPVALLAEEIETPGEGQIKALVTIAGNPVVSAPNSGRMRAALESLDCMLSVDIYVNETTRHADVVLPAPSAFHRSHYDLGLYQLAIRSVANFSPAVLGPDPEIPDEWRTLARLAGVASGMGPDCDVDALDEMVIRGLVDRELKGPGSPLEGRSAEEILEALEPRVGPERALDLMLRVGPFGDRFGDDPDGLTLDKLEAEPHGIDLGALEPRVPQVLRTESGRIELAPPAIADDVPRLEAALARQRNGQMVLIGRRQLRSNNSWMHNVPHLVRGADRCTAHLHPVDAERLGLEDGARARVSSTSGEIEVAVEVTDAVMEGVVSIPHGWGHDEPGVKLSVAGEHPGVNSNVLADENAMDPLSGNAVLNGIPVELSPVRAEAPAPA